LTRSKTKTFSNEFYSVLKINCNLWKAKNENFKGEISLSEGENSQNQEISVSEGVWIFRHEI